MTNKTKEKFKFVFLFLNKEETWKIHTMDKKKLQLLVDSLCIINMYIDNFTEALLFGL